MLRLIGYLNLSHDFVAAAEEFVFLRKHVERSIDDAAHNLQKTSIYNKLVNTKFGTKF